MRRALLLLAALPACREAPAARAPVPATAPALAPQVAPGLLEARPLLGDLPVKAQRFGAGPLAIVASGPMSEGERVGAFVEIPKDSCLLAYARAAASLEDIDLAAFGEEGNPVAVDEGPDPKPTLLVCPSRPDRLWVAAHAAAGEGLCVIAAQLVPRERADAVGRAVNAHGAKPRSPETWPGLEEQILAHRTAIGGKWEELRRVAVAVDARAPSAVPVVIEEGGCVDALVVPDDDVAVLDVDVFDGEGRVVARARDTSPSRSVTICSQTAVSGSLQVRPHVGRGLVAVVLGKAKGDGARELSMRPEVAWVSAPLPLDAMRGARERALARAGYGPAASAKTGQLQLGRRVTVPVDLSLPCARIDVVAGAPLAQVEAAAWDDSGALLGTGDGADGAVVFACAKPRARVDLGARGRPGPYAVLVRPERWSDASFKAYPLAASRMLARASGAEGVHAGKPGAVRHAVLEPARRHVQGANLAANQCLQVALGVEGEGTGVEVRLFDAVSGDELDRSHGQTSASVRACSEDAPRSLRVEARATAGRLDAVIGERILAGP
jgi:hypothetical protein